MEQTKRMIKDYFQYVYYSHVPVEHMSILPLDNAGLALPDTWEFWKEYMENSFVYDRRFYDMFGSYKFRELDDFIIESFENHEYVDISLIEFKNSVVALLTTNAKKYNELYRMYSVSDEDYMLLDNYNVTETMDRDTSGSESKTVGARTDSASETLGSRSDSASETLGSRSDSSSSTKGSRTDSVVNAVSPYDTETFYHDTNSNTNVGEQTDTASATQGQQNNTSSKTQGEQSNTSSTTIGSHTDTMSQSGSEDYTLTRRGNIGVQTGADMLKKHENLWDGYQFYDMIFKDIARELLNV